MTQFIEYTEILASLQKEIILHPEKKHRIILKAIKTAKYRENKQAIRPACRRAFRPAGREFFKQEFR